VAICVGVEFE